MTAALTRPGLLRDCCLGRMQMLVLTASETNRSIPVARVSRINSPVSSARPLRLTSSICVIAWRATRAR
eukprot:559327-Pleurochrysis_carterae.AAC.1